MCRLGVYEMEKRQLKVIFSKSGGTAGKGSVTNRLTIPTTWVKEMNINSDDREVIALFDGKRIIIEKGAN